jgi:hypothetical protein
MVRKALLACTALIVLGAQVVSAQEDVGLTQNAMLEGVQLSSEPSPESGEKVVSCYFIFRDKPSSFFYEVKDKEKKLVFEFNDVKLGAAPIESMSEPPIKGFSVEERRVDVNSEIKGLEPEWHSVVKATFDLDNIPIITVNEEYSVISFSYKWTSDPTKLEKYVAGGSNAKWWIIGGSAGAVVAAAVVVAVALAGEDPVVEAPEALDIDDLPDHGEPEVP